MICEVSKLIVANFSKYVHNLCNTTVKQDCSFVAAEKCKSILNGLMVLVLVT